MAYYSPTGYAARPVGIEDVFASRKDAENAKENFLDRINGIYRMKREWVMRGLDPGW
jgi:hypothetical protein